MTNNALVLGGCFIFAFLWNTFMAGLGISPLTMVMGVTPGSVTDVITVWAIPNVLIFVVGAKAALNLS